MSDTTSPIRKAKARLFGTAAEEIPVAFEVKCKCGQKLTGTRRTSWQQSVCPECHATHYVLPVNVYPQTAEVFSEVIGGSFMHRLTFVAKELLGGSPTEQSATTRRKAKQRTKESDKTETKSTESTPRRKLSLPKITLPTIDVVGIAKRTFTPFRLLMFSIVGVVILTVGWTWHQRTIASARQTWRTSLDQIPEVLEDGNFGTLESLLTDAVAAGETLKKNDDEWRLILNLHQETVAFNQMSDADLLDIILAAYTQNDALTTDAQESVGSAIIGRTVLFDSMIVPDPSHDTFLVDMPLSPGGHDVLIRLQLPAASELITSTTADQYLFTASVARVQAPTNNDSGFWLIELDPKSLVLVTRDEFCDAYGLPLDEETGIVQRVQLQKDFVEQSEEWSRRDESVDRQQQALSEDNQES